MKPEEIMAFADQLRQLIGSGYPLAEGLSRFGAEIQSPGFKQTVEDVARRLSQGTSLGQALDGADGAFSPEFIGLVRAGEQSGALAEVLEVAIEHESFLARFEQRFLSAVTYASAVFAWSLICYALIAWKVIPLFEDFYRTLEAGAELPDRLRFFSFFFTGPGSAAFAILLAASILLPSLIKRRIGVATAASRVPGLKALVRDVASARLAKSLAALLKAGARVPESLAALAAATSDPGARKHLIAAGRRAEQGQRLSECLAAEGLGGEELHELVELGEESGALPSMLERASGVFMAEAEARLDGAVRLFGSGLLVGVGIWILILMSGWIQAYFNISNLALYFW